MLKKEIISMVNEEAGSAIRSGSMSSGDRFWIRDGNMLWTAADNASLAALSSDGIIALGMEDAAGSANGLTRLAALILLKNPGIRVLLLNRSHYPGTIALTGETLKPYVDDIAQIIGIDIKNLPADKAGKISRIFKNRSAVTIKGEGILCAGTSFDDAVAVAIIADKAAFIHIRGGFIGRLSFIGRIESALMRFVYRRKYSKQAGISGRE